MPLLTNLGLGVLATRNRKVEKLLRGQARILVNHGHVYQGNLQDERVNHEEVMQALRENGCGTLAECRLAVLEVDGREYEPHRAGGDAAPVCMVVSTTIDWR